MFENYLGTKKDFKAVEESLRKVWSKKIDFVFKKKRLIRKIVVTSFDSQNLYFWSTFKIPKTRELECGFKKYRLFKKPHRARITDKIQRGWQAGIDWQFFGLPKNFQNWYQFPVISGSLVTPFTKVHEKLEELKGSLDPYKSYESYLATIIHEFGHAYYNLHKNWWFSDKKENLSYLTLAKLIFENKKQTLEKIKLKIPNPPFLSEVFAFCTEYYVSSLFWPDHLKNINTFSIRQINKLIMVEKKKDLNTQDSVLGERTPHDTAMVIGRILLYLYPKTWPEKLLQKFTL